MSYDRNEEYYEEPAYQEGGSENEQDFQSDQSSHSSESTSDSGSRVSERSSENAVEQNYPNEEGESGGFEGAGGMDMVSGLMGNLMSGGDGREQGQVRNDEGYGYQQGPPHNEQYGRFDPQQDFNQDYGRPDRYREQEQYGDSQYGAQRGYDDGGYEQGFRQNEYCQQGYGQQQGGYDGRGQRGYGDGYPHPGPPPQQYENTGAGYAPPQAPYAGQQQQYGGYRPNNNDDGERHPQHFGPQFTDPQTGEVAQAFFEYSRCSGKRKALLIGINYIGSSNALRGCINDVHNVQKFVTERYGYQLEDIVMLTDDQDDARTMPTRENIIKGMKWLVEGAQRNDALFFHYSGHGTQAADESADEVDDDDEAICPVDYEECGLLIDDDMYAFHDLLVSPLPAGCRLTAIFDSCHSATIMDLPYVYSTDGTIKEPDLLAEASQGLLSTGMDILKGKEGGVLAGLFGAAKNVWEAKQAEEKTVRTKTSPADVVMWAGCRDDQTSADTQEAGKATGAMSYAFIASLNKNPNQSYVELLNSIREEMRGKYEQKPQLSACHPIDTDLQFVA